MHTVILDALFHDHFTDNECGARYICMCASTPTKQAVKEFIESEIVKDARESEYVYIADGEGNAVAYVTVPSHNVDVIKIPACINEPGELAGIHASLTEFIDDCKEMGFDGLR